MLLGIDDNQGAIIRVMEEKGLKG